MKIQNLFISIVLLLSVFSSCSNEELEHETTQTGMFSVTFRSQPMIETKAGTEPAEPDELIVKSYFIGFFSNNQLVAHSYHGFDDNNPENGTFKEGQDHQFRVENITVPYNKELKIVVIANTPKNYKDLKTYEQFQKVTVTYAEASDFTTNVRSLIKVGESTYTFDKNNLEAPVELTQLAAKVKLSLTFETTDEIVGNILKMDGENLVDEINKDYNGNGKPAKVKTLEDEGLLVECNGNAHGFGVSSTHVDNNGKSYDGKWMVIKCDYVETKTYTTWELVNPSVSINNIVLNSTFNIPDRPTSLDLASYVPTVLDLSKGLELVFYTYQKELLDDNSLDRLNVTIAGTLNNIKKEQSRTKPDALVHCMWAWNGNAIKNGWGNGNGFIIAKNGVTEGGDWTEFSKPVSVGGPIATIPNQTFVAWINPKKGGDVDTNGLMQGNYYEVTGLVKIEGKTTPNVSWKLENMNPEEIDVPSYN